MPVSEVDLASLTQVIESIQGAIRRDGRTIGANETRTRNTLIDPVLRALGWSDASVVTQEYLVRYGPQDSDYGVVDYALHPPGARANPMAFLEAKRMSEDLNDDHRFQVFKYALDKGGKLRHFGLTNGDRWEFYKLFDGEPFELLAFSVRTQSASDCARLLLDNFPVLGKPSVEESLQPVYTSPSLARDAVTESNPSEVSVIRSSTVTHQPDVPKILTWLAVSLVLAGILGWAFGVWNAKPIEGAFEYIGLFALFIGLIWIVVMSHRFYPSAVPVALKFLRLRWLFAPINGNRRKTMVWVMVVIVCGIGVGGVGSYFIGLQTGEAVSNVLRILGQLAVAVTVIGIIALVVLERLRQSSRRPPGGWRPRSSHRNRSW